MANQTDFREIIESKRVEIIDSLNCEKTYLLSYLRSKGVFDEEDCELIKDERTSKSRAGKCVDKLLKKGPEACQHFIDVLQVENSNLYELLTCEKATSKPSPLMQHVTNPNLNAGFCTLGLGMLAEHQQRLYSELQEVHRQYSALLHAKQELEGHLVTANKDLEFEKERREEYEKRSSTLQMAAKAQSNDETLLFHECDELQKGLADRDVYIIVLQMKLLAEKEECDTLKVKVEEVEQKVETMARDLRRASDNYNHERKQSMKLSECIRLQGEDIQKLDVFKQRLKESQFQNILLEDERDCARSELDELKKWAEALKQRFDVIEKEKYNFLEKNEHVTTSCVNLQESVKSLQRKLSLTQLETGELRQRNDMLSKDFDIYKKQRDCALDARKEAILERDKACSERDAIQRQYYELQVKRDKINEERAQLIQDFDSLKTRYKTSIEDLAQTKRTLNEKELEVGDLTRELDELLDKTRRNSTILNLNPATSEKNDDDVPESAHDSPEDDESEEKNNPWRDRKLKKLLHSMKLRIAGTRPIHEDNTNDPVSPATEMMTLQVLQCLLPNLNSRPYTCALQTGLAQAKNSTSLSRTIERQMAIRRQGAVNPPAVKEKSATLPCIRDSTILGDSSNDDEGPGDETRDRWASAPNIHAIRAHYDVNRLPERFRDRVKPVLTERFRSKSEPSL